jgi:hypothetical protein
VTCARSRDFALAIFSAESIKRWMRIGSPAFSDGAMIPRRFPCDGQNLSPPLAWTDVPEGARSLVIAGSHMASDTPLRQTAAPGGTCCGGYKTSPSPVAASDDVGPIDGRPRCRFIDQLLHSKDPIRCRSAPHQRPVLHYKLINLNMLDLIRHGAAAEIGYMALWALRHKSRVGMD